MKSKFLTWNIQAGIGTQAYHQYVTQAYRQFLHVPEKDDTLSKISNIISQYDVVSLQEVDLGGRRSDFQCQFQTLKSSASLPFGVTQENRTIGNLSRHGNAIFSRYAISDHIDLKLPGSRAGRGVLIARIDAPNPFYAVNTHLSLGESDQMKQLSFIADNLPVDLPYILMGDLNCNAASKPARMFAQKTGGALLTQDSHKTYPSWSPEHDYDHIIAGPEFRALYSSAALSPKPDVLDLQLSDHRPIAADFSH